MASIRRCILIVTFLFGPVTTVAAGETEELFKQLQELAQRGDPVAEYHLGMMHNNGLGTHVDSNRAFELFERSAQGGDPLGAYKLGCYYSGQFAGVVEIDEEKALAHKLISAKAGYALAQNDVGWIYYRRGKRNEAIQWFIEAAKQGYRGAFGVLASAYSGGTGVKKDPVQSYVYLRLSSSSTGVQNDERIDAAIETLRNEMSATEHARAEKLVSAYEPLATPLTLEARQGINAAKKYAASSLKKSE